MHTEKTLKKNVSKLREIRQLILSPQSITEREKDHNTSTETNKVALLLQ